MKNKVPAKLGPIGHINGFIVKRLRENITLFCQEDRFNIIDYLSEWALFYTRDKHVVELIRERVELNKRAEIGYCSAEALYIYTSLLFNGSNKPEAIMEKLLGEIEWKKIQKRLSLRNYMDSEFVRTTTKNYLNNNA